MKILTAGDKRFKDMIEFSIKRTEKLGYESIVYDLGGLETGEKFEVNSNVRGKYRGYGAKIPCKPELIRNTFDRINDFLVWIDGDAFLIGNIDEVMDGDYDIGVTMRRRDEITMHPGIVYPCNAGVVFIRHTEKAKEFLDRWIKKVPETPSGSDQHALNMFVREAKSFEEYEKGYGKIINSGGTKIKLFKTDMYNHYYFDETLEQAKILHFKGSRRKQYNKYKMKYEI